MAYGQTGSGKTHTMLSSHSVECDLEIDELGVDEGVIPRSAREIFRYFLVNYFCMRNPTSCICLVFTQKLSTIVACHRACSFLLPILDAC